MRENRGRPQLKSCECHQKALRNDVNAIGKALALAAFFLFGVFTMIGKSAPEYEDRSRLPNFKLVWGYVYIFAHYGWQCSSFSREYDAEMGKDMKYLIFLLVYIVFIVVHGLIFQDSGERFLDALREKQYLWLPYFLRRIL